MLLIFILAILKSFYHLKKKSIFIKIIEKWIQKINLLFLCIKQSKPVKNGEEWSKCKYEINSFLPLFNVFTSLKKYSIYQKYRKRDIKKFFFLFFCIKQSRKKVKNGIE